MADDKNKSTESLNESVNHSQNDLSSNMVDYSKLPRPTTPPKPTK